MSTKLDYSEFINWQTFYNFPLSASLAIMPKPRLKSLAHRSNLTPFIHPSSIEATGSGWVYGVFGSQVAVHPLTSLFIMISGWWRRFLRIRKPPQLRSSQDRATQGRLGEQIAADYLMKHQGMTVLTRNWRMGRFEIDIVCRDKETLVFVEVRTRREGSLVSGYWSLTKKKRKALLTAFRCYMKTLPEKPWTYRFDVVEIRSKAMSDPEINYLRNIRIFPK